MWGILSNVTPEQKGRVSLLWMTVSSRLASLLKWKTANTAFLVQSFNFQVCRYSATVAMFCSAPLLLFASLNQRA